MIGAGRFLGGELERERERKKSMIGMETQREGCVELSIVVVVVVVEFNGAILYAGLGDGWWGPPLSNSSLVLLCSCFAGMLIGDDSCYR